MNNKSRDKLVVFGRIGALILAIIMVLGIIVQSIGYKF